MHIFLLTNHPYSTSTQYVFHGNYLQVTEFSQDSSTVPVHAACPLMMIILYEAPASSACMVATSLLYKKLLHCYRALVIVDEVQSGMGCTGRWQACELSLICWLLAKDWEVVLHLF